MPRRNEISEDLRSKIVDLHRAGKGYKVISRSLDIHHSTVRKIVYKWRRFSTVATLPRSGRPAGRPAKTSAETPAETPRRKTSQVDTVDSHVPAGPADVRGGGPDQETRDCITVPDDSDNTGSEDEDPVVGRVSAEPTDDGGGASDQEVHRGETSSASSDETTEEDPMEQFLDADFYGEKKIYPGSSVTAGALLLLLLAFILKHGLSKAAVKDLLDLLNCVVPGCVPKSQRFLKKHLTDCNDKTEVHFCCPSCTHYLGVDPGTECGACRQSLNRKGLLEKAHCFLVRPLEIQLRRVLADVHSKLGKHFTRDATFSDVPTGSEYQSERQDDTITLTFTCDGSPVFSSSGCSVWSILCTINELPYVERCKNVLLHTLWFGRGKPRVQSFFTPFIRELQKLSTAGFYWTDENGSEHRTRVTAKICTCDPAARAMMQNFNPFSREFGCGFCYHKGEMVEKGGAYTRVYPVQVDGCDLRHMSETVQIAEFVMENGYDQGQMGVKGPSPLLLLPSFDIIKGFIPDYRHCFCLGVVRQFVSLWFDPLYANKDFHLTPQHLKDLDRALCEIQPPSEIRRGPRRLSDRTHWKPSEWRAFALLYAPVILRKVLPAAYYKHWMLLASALHTLLSQFATQDELSCAELCLVQFVAKVPSLYGLEHCSYDCHLLTHLTESARDWGLLWATSVFVFEDVNDRLLQMYSGTRSVSSQVFKQFLSYEKVVGTGSAVLQEASTEVKDFFGSMTGCDIVTEASQDIGGGLVTLGCGSRRLLTVRETAALQKSDTLTWYQQHHDGITEYKRCVCNNMFVTTLDYSVSIKRNNSVIETTKCFAVVESLVVVPKPCSCEGGSSCSCRELVIFCRRLQRLKSQPAIHDAQINTNVTKFLVKVRRSNDLCAVTSGDVTAKCFMTEHEGQLYVMTMPVLEAR